MSSGASVRTGTMLVGPPLRDMSTKEHRSHTSQIDGTEADPITSSVKYSSADEHGNSKLTGLGMKVVETTGSQVDRGIAPSGRPLGALRPLPRGLRARGGTSPGLPGRGRCGVRRTWQQRAGPVGQVGSTWPRW